MHSTKPIRSGDGSRSLPLVTVGPERRGRLSIYAKSRVRCEWFRPQPPSTLAAAISCRPRRWVQTSPSKTSRQACLPPRSRLWMSSSGGPTRRWRRRPLKLHREPTRIAAEHRVAGLAGRGSSGPRRGIQKLEAQFGIPLFDRTAYRPALTEAGQALLPRARRIAEETNAFRDTARSLASGLEAELTIVLDSMFPMRAVVEALRAFTAKFPTVTPRIYVQSLGAAAELVLDGTCMIGLLPLFFSDMANLKRFPLLTVDLVAVAAPDHPLAV